jgi:FKBP-type peptidyl-prolyl cis-trans isomerase
VKSSAQAALGAALVSAVAAFAACGYSDPTPATGAVATEVNASPSPVAGDDFNAGAGKTPIKLPDGLQYIDLNIGTGALATRGEQASVQYTGWLADGRKFDSSRDSGKPFEFTIGSGEAIGGWEEGIPGMKVGGKRKLIVPPNLGYGAQGSPPLIPANATLVFVVELVSVAPGPSPSASASP